MQNRTPQISVIIPVYNARNSLERCLNSVHNQSFLDFELILVDDGSTDNSGAICDDYAKANERIFVIHQKNKGVSSARNAGINAAVGRQIVFIDADDYVSPDYLAKLKSNDYDLVISGHDSDGIADWTEKNLDYNSANSEESMLSLLEDHFMLTVWAKAFNSSIIKQNRILFDESLNYGEDTLFVNCFIKYIKNAKSISYIGYHYMHSEHSSLSQNRLRHPLSQRVDYVQKLLDLWVSEDTILQLWAKRFLYNAENEIRNITTDYLNESEKKRYIKMLLSHSVFQRCAELVPNYFSPINKILIKLQCYTLILHRYKRR